MQVTNIEVSFKRTRQPAQYETSGAEVKWSVALEEGENPITATEKAIGDVKSIVLAELGLTKPGTNASASQTASVAETAPAPAKPAAAPKKPTQTQAKTTAAKPVEEDPHQGQPTSNGVRTDGPAPGESDDIPGEGNAPTVKTTQTSAADIPGDEAPKATAAQATKAAETATGNVTLEELNALAHQYRKDGKVDTATIKGISRDKFGVERISDLKPEQLAPYKEALEAAVKAFGGPDGI